MMVPAARLVMVAALVALPAATIGGASPAATGPCVAILILCAAVAGIDAILARRRIQSLLARVPASLRLTKNVAAAIPITLDNRGTRELPVRLALTFPDPMGGGPSAVQSIAAGPGALVIHYPCTAQARGDHRLTALDLETRSPFGLWLVRVTRKLDCTLRVYPNLRDHATAALFLRTADPGARLRRLAGKGREFDNLRQYMPGDSFEDIHWKATAKRNYPAVKLYRAEHAQELYAVVDASRLSAREGILENYVDAALHLALVAERQGDRFGLVTFSDRTQRIVRARSGMDHFRLCRETIYNLRAQRVSPDFRDVFTSLQLNLRRRSLLVFFTSLDDALLAETFEREAALLARRHLVVVFVSQTPGVRPLFTEESAGDLESIYGALAGQMALNRMKELKIALQNRGVKLSVAEPARIKQQVANAYLDVKRRQAL